LADDAVLLSNITSLKIHCVNNTSFYPIHDVQVVYQLHCACHFEADEFFIPRSSNHCSEFDNITVNFSPQYLLNLAYISEFVNFDLLTSLSETLFLNSTVSADFPELAVASPEYDAKLAIEDRAVYDLSTILNLTKQDTMSFDSLSHFLYNKLLSSHTENESFDFLKCF